jgi:hypothetical protein
MQAIDDKCNALWRKLEALKRSGEGGKLTSAGWIGASSEYTATLAELRVLCNERISTFQFAAGPTDIRQGDPYGEVEL